MHRKMSFRLVCCFILVAYCLVGVCADTVVADEPRPPLRPVKTSTYERDGELFVVTVLKRPLDYSVGEDHDYYISDPTVWPRLPSLTGNPAWRFPFYMDRTDYGSPIWNPDAEILFIGRTPIAPSLQLTLRYPTGRLTWGEQAVEIDLSAADKAAPGERSDFEPRWARAQALWFRALGANGGSAGGFFAYAESQTIRKYAVPDYSIRATQSRLPAAPREQLYDLTTGAIAIQESLQLDRMTSAGADRGQRVIPIASISGVETRSHAFDSMRGGKKPVDTPLARFVPEDQYFLRFATISKLRQLLRFADGWGPSLLRIAEPVGTDYEIDTRLRQQLCLPDTLVARLLGPAVIRELAVTGSDPYLREGSDVTILFDVKARTIFTEATDRHLRKAIEQTRGVKRDFVEYSGVAIECMVDPLRRVSCHRCWLDDVCIYSNSLPALQRVIDVHLGKRARLSEAADYQYMRAVVFPHDEKVEDGFLYLSDAFIRRLAGPEVRIKEKRRLEAFTSLKMIENAAAFHGYTYGPARVGMNDLVASDCLEPADLWDPEGGQFTFDAATGVARSSVWGEIGFLTPLVEIACEHATETERGEYRQFRERYENLWRDFFDPIGVRIRVDQTIRLETCILPLVRTQGYDLLRALTQGDPIKLESQLLSPNAILRICVHLNDASRGLVPFILGGYIRTDWLGDWCTVWVDDTDQLYRAVRNEFGFAPPKDEKPGVDDWFGNLPAVVGVHVQDPEMLASALSDAKSNRNRFYGDRYIFQDLPLHEGHRIVKITRGRESSRKSDSGDAEPMIKERGPAIYYAVIQDGFYVSFQVDALRRLIDRNARKGAQAINSEKDNPSGEAARTPEAAKQAHALLSIVPGTAQAARPTLDLGLEHMAQRVTHNNLMQVWMLGRCNLLPQRTLDDAARVYLGYRINCPHGGSYSYDSDRGTAISTIYGDMFAVARLEAAPPASPQRQLVDSIDTVRASLEFTPEGVKTVVEIKRKSNPQE